MEIDDREYCDEIVRDAPAREPRCTVQAVAHRTSLV